MKSILKMLTLSLLIGSMIPEAKAVDINLINIDVASPEARRAEQLYGNAYGFPPEQVTPALLAPAAEVPAILQIAQAAGTVPLSIMMMRKMGMSYSNIMQTFAVAPLVAMGSPVTDTGYITTSRTHFLQNILQVNPLFIPKIPFGGPDFTRYIIYPVHREHGYWMPPGIAKKYGLWIPPGQAKKMGLWGGQGNYWGVDDDDHGGKWKKGHSDDDDGHGWKKAGKGHGNGGGKGGGKGGKGKGH